MRQNQTPKRLHIIFIITDFFYYICLFSGTAQINNKGLIETKQYLYRKKTLTREYSRDVNRVYCRGSIFTNHFKCYSYGPVEEKRNIFFKLLVSGTTGIMQRVLVSLLNFQTFFFLVTFNVFQNFGPVIQVLL